MIRIKRIISWKYFGTSAGFALSLGAGFMLSDAKVAGVAAFSDISLAGAMELVPSSAVFTGSLLRSILDGAVGHNIVKLSALALIVMIKLFLEPKNDPKLCGINTFVSVLVSGTAVSAVIGELVYKLPFYGFYAIPSSRGSSRLRDQTHVSPCPALAGGLCSTAPPGSPWTCWAVW